MTWACNLHEEIIGTSLWCSEERLYLFVGFVVVLSTRSPREV